MVVVVVPEFVLTCCCMPLALQRDKFEDMLRRLTAERADVCAAMAFAMDNAESGGWAGGVTLWVGTSYPGVAPCRLRAVGPAGAAFPTPAQRLTDCKLVS